MTDHIIGCLVSDKPLNLHVNGHLKDAYKSVGPLRSDDDDDDPDDDKMSEDDRDDGKKSYLPLFLDLTAWGRIHRYMTLCTAMAVGKLC